MELMDIDEIPLMVEREYGTPEGTPEIAVGFGTAYAQNAKKSKAEGRPIFDERVVIRKVVPGTKDVIVRLADDTQIKLFPKAYQAFKDRTADKSDSGTPLEMWPQLTRPLVYALRVANIHTVEALAAVHDGNVDAIGSNGRELRAQAQAYLKLAKDTAASQALAADNEKLRSMLADQQRQITELAAQLGGSDKRGPGRPRKEQAA